MRLWTYTPVREGLLSLNQDSKSSFWIITLVHIFGGITIEGSIPGPDLHLQILTDDEET